MRKVLLYNLILGAVYFFNLNGLYAQQELVKDINPGAGWASIDFKFRIGDQFYFTTNSDFGSEIWVSDGTTNGTQVLKDINPGAFADSDPADFVEFNGFWFFTAGNEANGREIWRTDGTTDGTILFKDIRVGQEGADPQGLVVIHNTLYFSANDGMNGTELWKSDGTEAGTVMVADILPGVSGSSPEHMTALGTEIAFSANDGTNGKELWKTDGTSAGTTFVKDIVAGASSSFPESLTSVGNKLYFIADNGILGKEVWISDGTSGGTLLTTDIAPGALHPSAENLTAVGDFLFFTADDGVSGIELYRSDVNAAIPASELVEIFPDTFGSTPTDFIMLNDDLLFNANSGGIGYELWKASASDGSVALVKDINPGFKSSSPVMLAVLNNELIFTAKGNNIGFELWKTDGTDAGTVLLGDLNTDPSTDESDSSPTRPLVKDNVLYFSATDYINGYQIWRTDGTTSSTQRLTSIPHDTIFDNLHKPYFLNNIGNTVINFVGLSDPYGEELWKFEVDPVTISGTMTNSPLDCNGDTDGTITISITGGVGDSSCFNYAWSEAGLSGLNLTGLTAGAYTLTVTDCVGFETITTVTIEEPDPVSGTTQEIGMISCNGDTNGQATAGGMGGTAPYTYAWDNGTNGATVNNLDAGLHRVTITDSNMCTGIATITLSEPTAISASTSAAAVICSGTTDGEATVNPSGGTAPYTFLWDNDETTTTATNLSGGTHNVTITDSNNCTLVSSVFIEEFAAIEIAFNVQNVSCIDGNNGSISAAATGGNGSGYTYTWADGTTGSVHNDLAEGTICVTVTDANGCNGVDCATVLAPAVSANVNANVSCFGGTDGQATVTINNANSTYTYNWDNGETNAMAEMLNAGVHTVTVTDALNCTSVQTVSLTEPTAFVFSDSLSASPDCFGVSNGFVTYNFSGGTAPYAYSWSTGATTSTGTLGGLSGGQTYCATVTDARECEVFTFCSTLVEPEEITASLVNSSGISCFDVCDGIVEINITNGAIGSDLSFIWPSGETNTGSSSTASSLCVGLNTVTITDGTCTVTESYLITGPEAIVPTINTTTTSCFGAADGSVSAVAIGGFGPYTYAYSDGTTDLAAGTYTLTVTDANNCQTVESFTINQPEEIGMSFETRTPSCIGAADGSVNVLPAGGTAPFTFAYSEGPEDLTAGTYTVTVTDANNCSAVDNFMIVDPTPIVITSNANDISCFGGNDGMVAATATGGSAPYSFEYSNGATELSAGTYQVTATDSNGCSQVDSFEITEPGELMTEVMAADISCFGETDGSASVTGMGGTMPYTFNYSTPTPTSLAGGTYFVTTTDARGCEKVDSFQIVEPTAIEVDIMTTDASCFGANDGGATIAVSGGVEPYEMFDDVYTDLTAGDYGVMIVDANGCELNETITIEQPVEIVLSTSSTDATGTEADGTATVSVTGGVMPLTYAWNSTPVQDTETATDLAAGDYMVTVTDASGCTVIGMVTVDMFTNTQELDESLRFEVMPNPANALATIDLEFGEVLDVEMNIYNSIGQKVYQRSFERIQNDQVLLNVEDFAQGVYWIQISTQERQFVRKLSVLKL